MYGEVQASSAVPVLATAGVAAVLPETGASTAVNLAVAVLVGLITWGAVYYFRAVRAKKAS